MCNGWWIVLYLEIFFNILSLSFLDQDEEEEDEWEWEEDDDATSSRSSKRGKRVDSTSSRDLSSAELKKDSSIASQSSSTRKLLTEMEFGAYNSDSICSPGHNSGNSDGAVSMSEQSHESPAMEGDSDYNLDDPQKEDIEDNEEDVEEDEEDEGSFNWKLIFI